MVKGSQLSESTSFISPSLPYQSQASSRLFRNMQAHQYLTTVHGVVQGGASPVLLPCWQAEKPTDHFQLNKNVSLQNKYQKDIDVKSEWE